MRTPTLPSLLLILSLASTTLAAPKPPGVKRPGTHNRRNTNSLLKRAPNQVDLSATAPTTSAPKKNVWNSLSIEEAASVKQFLHTQADLNLTAWDNAYDWDNMIMTVDLAPPSKASALDYIDGAGGEPVRTALVSVLFGATEQPWVSVYTVDLPITETTQAVLRVLPSGPQDGKIRVFDNDSNGGFIRGIALEMKDVVNDLLQTTIDTEADLRNRFALFGIDPLWHDANEAGEKRTIKWVQFWRYSDDANLPSGGTFSFDDLTLLPQGLYIGVDITGRDKSQWSLVGIYYNGLFYATIDEFRSAWQAEGFTKLKPNIGGEWSTTDKQGGGLAYDDVPPPRQVQPGGQRFEVDVKEKYVKWMDFTFYITFTRDTGVRLYDIRFKGERILYELGLQEAIAHYAGQDPVQSGIAYIDSYYGFGPYAFNLVPGYDIPEYAQCLEGWVHQDETMTNHECAMALFEVDQNYPLQRHTDNDYVSATKNIALTLRTTNTIGNYDYQFDYVFYMDGTIETLVRASGYIQTAYYANNGDYGYHIHESLSGSMHDHVLTFKADFDILGTKNTMVKHAFVPSTENYAWSKTPRNTFKLNKWDVTNENDGKMNWAANGAEQVLIVNKDQKNEFGEERGYKIMPHKGGGMHITAQDSSNLKNSHEFTKNQYYVTQYKDTETYASCPWNAYDVENPLIDFNKYFDGENLVQEDIVVWYNLGMHHVPHTGDLPNTVFTTAQSSVMITPHNYHTSDPSRQTSQMIRINYGDDNASDVNKFGQQDVSGSVDMAQNVWDASTYHGGISTRKFPYEGLGQETTTSGEERGSTVTRRRLES